MDPVVFNVPRQILSTEAGTAWMRAWMRQFGQAIRARLLQLLPSSTWCTECGGYVGHDPWAAHHAILDDARATVRSRETLKPWNRRDRHIGVSPVSVTVPGRKPA